MSEALDFDPYSDVFFNDPYDVYRRLRDEAPVYRNDHYGFWALSRYDDVVTAHRDWKTFTSTQGITIDMLTDPDMAALLKQSTGFDDLHGPARTTTGCARWSAGSSRRRPSPTSSR